MDALTLYDLNIQVRRCIDRNFTCEYWLQAEISELRTASNGHCYLEFVQKDTRGNGLIAKARGNIWANVYRIIKPYFEKSTGQVFCAGIKVLVQVSVNFHELYGYSLTVTDIDPTYTLGDMARRRREILQQLEAEGVLTLNKELAMPVLPQRIAVISSAGAAGYGDFCHQLYHNPHGFGFRIELFAAWMQGDRVEESILAAFDQIVDRQDEFDVVVIIRGGGATSDLSGFDTYLLAASCAQFPLPVITGIGHERDDTVLDAVAHTRVKTPTAAAAYLIGCMEEASAALINLSQRLGEGAEHLLLTEQKRLKELANRFPAVVMRRLQTEHVRLESQKHRIPAVALRRLSDAKIALLVQKKDLFASVEAIVRRERHNLALRSQQLADASPQRLLERGYSLTLCRGQVVKDVRQLRRGDELVTRFGNGEVKSTVTGKSIHNNINQ